MADKKTTTTAPPTTLLGKLDYIDKTVSGWIHSCKVKPVLLELIIFPFAYLFQPVMFPLLLTVVGVFIPTIEKNQRAIYLNKGANVPGDYGLEEQGEYQSYLERPAFIAVQYLSQIVVMLVLTTFTKRLFNRPRPTIPSPDCRRMIDLRSKEKNCSFPSGDAA